MKKITLPNEQIYKIKTDNFQKTRGTSKILKIYCSKCSNLLFIYQKDGPGQLKRSYLDRIAWPEKYPSLCKMKQNYTDLDPIICEKCNQLIAVPMNYAKENRTAYKIMRTTTKKKNFVTK